MKNNLATIFLILAVIFACGCSSNNQTTQTTTIFQTSTPDTTLYNFITPSVQELVQKGLSSDAIKNRGFYRDEEFIIIGVLQNPNNFPVSINLNYSLYDELNRTVGFGNPKNGDIVNGYLPAKGVMPLKINCGKTRNVSKYVIDWDLKETTGKTDNKFNQTKTNASIIDSTVSINGGITNIGPSRTKNTRLVAILYDANDKAIDALAAYALPIDITPNSTASFDIESAYPKNYAEYLKKITYYRLFIQDVYEPDPINVTSTTTRTIPIEITGLNNTEVRIK